MAREGEYYKRLYAKRVVWIHEYLGGKCSRFDEACKWEVGETLDVDHIDRLLKTMDFKNMALVDPDHPRHRLLLKELENCQLLCKQCHARKSHMERGHNPVAAHGTRTCYRKGCRETPCVEAAKRYESLRYQKHKDDPEWLERKRALAREGYHRRK